MNRNALIYLWADYQEGINRLKQKVFSIRKNFQIQNASSVYKRYESQGQKEIIEVVIEVTINESQTPQSLGQEIKSQDGILLAVEGELRVDPELPLPHPILLLDTAILKMSAECVPHWEHCVKLETLQALSDQNTADSPVEFLTQGQALINVLA